MINVRQNIAYSLRKNGYTFKSIGAILNVTGCRANQIYKSAKRQIEDTSWDKLLTVRAQRIIQDADPNIKSFETLKKAVLEGKFERTKHRYRNFGNATSKEIYNFVEVPYPKKITNICGKCGNPLDKNCK